MKPIILLQAAALACFPALPASAADLNVKMGYGLFEPARISVKRGDQVVFRNDDTQAHTVTSNDKGQSFKLGELKPGQARAKAFEKPGVVKVICDYHPGMEMTVTVR